MNSTREVTVYSKERELLLKLLENYEPETDLEKAIKFSIYYKVKEAYNLTKLSDAEIAEEIQDRIMQKEDYKINWYLEEDAFPMENYIYKPQNPDVHILYGENYWTGMMHLSNNDGIHLIEAIKILKKEKPEKHKELIEKVSKSFAK
jgi:hypothetical protein